MVVWIAAYFLIVLIGLIYKPVDNKRKGVFLILSAIVLIFIMGSRDISIIADSDPNNYYRLYERAIHMAWQPFYDSSTMEIGYLSINFILAKLIPWPQFIIYAQAAFCIISYLIFLYRNTNNVYFGVLFFMTFGGFQFYLTGFRQSIAMCLCLFAFEAAKNKKLIRFTIIVILAALIHQTAIIFAVVYIIVNLKPGWQSTAVLLVALLPLSFFSEYLIQFGNDVFDKSYIGRGESNLLRGIVEVLIYIITLFLTKATPTMNKTSKNIQIYRMTLTGLMLYLMRYSALVIERISFYFTGFTPVLLCESIENVKNEKSHKLLTFLAVVCSFGLFIWRVMTQYENYGFFWA